MSDELNAKLNTVNDVYTIHLHVDCFHVMFQPASVVVYTPKTVNLIT